MLMVQRIIPVRGGTSPISISERSVARPAGQSPARLPFHCTRAVTASFNLTVHVKYTKIIAVAHVVDGD